MYKRTAFLGGIGLIMGIQMKISLFIHLPHSTPLFTKRLPQFFQPRINKSSIFAHFYWARQFFTTLYIFQVHNTFFPRDYFKHSWSWIHSSVYQLTKAKCRAPPTCTQIFKIMIIFQDQQQSASHICAETDAFGGRGENYIVEICAKYILTNIFSQIYSLQYILSKIYSQKYILLKLFLQNIF